MRFTDRVVSLHPAIVTIVFVVFFFGGGVAVNMFPFGSVAQSFSFSITMVLMLGPLMLWHYSLYRASTDRNIQSVGHRGRRAFLFVLNVLGMAAYLFLFPSMMLSIHANAINRGLLIAEPSAMVVGVLSYFAAIWAAANALTRFDERAKSVEFHKTLGTFILELYLPIGIWVIYPRIKRMLAAPISTSHS